MKKVLLAVLTFFSASVFAQKSDTLVTYNFGKIPTKKIKQASSVYKIFKEGDTSWVRTTSDDNLVILKKETFSDSTLKVLNGSFECYQNGKPCLKGSYLNNQRSGEWIFFNTEGQRTSLSTYTSNKSNGLSLMYWENGQIQEEGKFVDDKKQGEWKMFYETGELGLKETYDQGNLLDSAYLDRFGKPTIKDSIFKQPFYPGGMNMFYRYLSKSVKYPYQDLKKNNQGKVYLSFTVTKSGLIEDIEVLSAPSPTLAAEATRVLEASRKWIPGRVFNKEANVLYHININFALN